VAETAAGDLAQQEAGASGIADVRYVAGDATKVSYGGGRKIIAHIVNDKGRWGKGFVMAISREWGKGPQRAYFEWHRDRPQSGFRLGSVQFVVVSPRIEVANMVSQSGTKTGSQGAPIRYGALEEALGSLAQHAAEAGATVHMPRIGCGLAGGDWTRVAGLVDAASAAHGVTVYVYG